MKMNKKHITLFGAYCCNNIGDDIFFYTLEKIFSEKYGPDNFTISIISANPDNVYESTSKVHYVNRRYFVGVLKTIISSNAVIIGPGSIFSGLFSSQRESLFVFWISLFTKLFLKKLIFLGIDYSPQKTQFLSFLSLACLVLSDKIYARFRDSYLSLDKFPFLTDKLEMIDDITFCKYFTDTFLPKDKQSKTSKQICVVISDLSFSFLIEMYEEFLAYTILKLKNEGYTLKVLSLNMTSYGNKDIEYFSAINEKYNLGCNPNEFITFSRWNQQNISQVVTLIGTSEYILSNKLHSSIIASIVGTNIISFSYHNKMRSLNHLLQLNPLFDFNTDSISTANIDELKLKFETKTLESMKTQQGLNFLTAKVDYVLGNNQSIIEKFEI